MAEQERTTKLKALGNSFSVKSFISDLPRLINNALSTIVNVLLSFYTPTSDSKGNIHDINRLECTYIDAVTVNARNLIITTANGEKVNYADLATKISKLESDLSKIKAITKEQIQEIYDSE